MNLSIPDRVVVFDHGAVVSRPPSDETAGNLGIGLEQMLFIDDKKANTDAAALLGATVHRVEGAAGLDAFLTDLAS